MSVVDNRVRNGEMLWSVTEKIESRLWLGG